MKKRVIRIIFIEKPLEQVEYRDCDFSLNHGWLSLWSNKLENITSLNIPAWRVRCVSDEVEEVDG